MNIGSLFGRSIQKSPYQKVLEQMLAEQANDDVANVATESKYFRLYGEKVGCSPAILCAIDCMYAVVQQEAKRSTDALDAMFGEARLMREEFFEGMLSGVEQNAVAVRELEEQELVLERVDTSYVRGDVITATKCKHAEDTDEIKRALQLFVGSGHVPAQLMPRVLPLLPPVDYIAPSEYRSQESPSDDSCLRMDPQPMIRVSKM
eukprot:gene8397-18291_t